MTDSRGLILAIDQGTTNTKVVLVNAAGDIVGHAARPMSVRYPQPAWVEQDAEDIWRSVSEAIDECLIAAQSPTLAAIAISNQRESVVVWDRATGKAAGPVVVWQCRRGTELCAEIRKRGLSERINQLTGLAVDPMFSASKIRWLLDHIPDGHTRAERGELLAGTIDSWVLWNLSGGQVHACDLTNASRTQLLNIKTLQWSDELLQAFGIPRAALPDLRSSSGDFGVSVACGCLPAGIPIRSMIGDSHAALFGQAGFQPGSVKATYGTGSSLMTPTPAPIISQHGISTTVAWALDREHVTYALEGNILVTGAAVRWLSQFLALGGSDAVAALANTVSDSAGLYLVPAFVGLGAPHWNDQARGLISGLTFGASTAHLARATIESIAYQVRDVFDLMQTEAGIPLNTLFADGGASKNDMLMQFQADILGCSVMRAASANASAMGAAYLAGLAVGIWKDLDAIQQLPRPRDRFAPTLLSLERNTKYDGWQAAVRKLLVDSSQ